MLAQLTPPRIFVATGLTLLAAIGIGAALGDLDRQFRESSIVTYASVTMLGLCAWVTLSLGRKRRAGDVVPRTDPRRVWTAIGLGFAWLALDDLAQIHENLDKLVHYVAGLEETPLSDRIDDMIILAYGLIGAAVMWLWRDELRRFPVLLPWLAGGAVMLVLQVGLDALFNDTGWQALLGVEAARRPLVYDIGQVFEESTKLLAGAFFLSGFALARRRAGPAA